MEKNETKHNTNRMGMHYFPDTLHYRESDLNTWLPELKALGAGWLTLLAPEDRAIPEAFVRGLIEAGITPVLHFQLSPENPPSSKDFAVLIQTYARWGVEYAALFDQPNCRCQWSAEHWSQHNLVERFLDIYLPLAKLTMEAGMTPIFPPLEPGGDYWDTAFLRAALEGMQRRGEKDLLGKLVLGAYGWAGEKPLNWGAGGPESWAGAKPYFTPEGEQDQRGFHIFDWYTAISKAVLVEARPIILLRAGSAPSLNGAASHTAGEISTHSERNAEIVRLLKENGEGEEKRVNLEGIPDNVIACNFWLLSAEAKSPYAGHAWFQADGSKLPVVTATRELAWQVSTESTTPVEAKSADVPRKKRPFFPINHYVLLPTDRVTSLQVIQPFVNKYKATVGFSWREAACAGRVTVVGGEHTFSEEQIEKLRAAGSIVDWVRGDTSNLANKLASL